MMMDELVRWPQQPNCRLWLSSSRRFRAGTAHFPSFDGLNFGPANFIDIKIMQVLHSKHLI